jgi:membrane protein YqaA with SNARE-associated domain
MMQSLLDFLQSLGPWGPCLAAFIDGLGLPNPSGPDIFLVWLAARQPAEAYFSAALSVVASLTGNFILYWIARKGGQAYLDRKLTGPRSLRFRAWFQTYGLVTVFVPALLPIPLPLKAFEICAGALGVGPLPYLGALLAGRLPRYFGLAWLGREMGEHSVSWLKIHVWHFTIFGLLLFALLYLLIKAAGRYRFAAGAGRRTAS